MLKNYHVLPAQCLYTTFCPAYVNKIMNGYGDEHITITITITITINIYRKVYMQCTIDSIFAIAHITEQKFKLVVAEILVEIKKEYTCFWQNRKSRESIQFSNDVEKWDQISCFIGFCNRIEQSFIY